MKNKINQQWALSIDDLEKKLKRLGKNKKKLKKALENILPSTNPGQEEVEDAEFYESETEEEVF